MGLRSMLPLRADRTMKPGGENAGVTQDDKILGCTEAKAVAQNVTLAQVSCKHLWQTPYTMLSTQCAMKQIEVCGGLLLSVRFALCWYRFASMRDRVQETISS